MSFLRKFFFYFFFLIFIVFCPIIVLYALGYLFKPGHEQGIVKTGLIYAATVPAGAQVRLDGKLLEKPTPNLMLDLMPGDYQLDLRLDGYRPWSQKLPVEAGKATVVDKILLVPETYLAEVIAQGAFRELTAFHKGSHLLLTGSNRLSEVTVVELKSGSILPLIPASNPLSEKRYSRFFSSASSPYVIFEIENGAAGPLYYRIKAGDANPEIRNLTALFLKAPEKVIWNSAEENMLFAVRAGTVDRLDLTEQAVAPGFLDGVRGVGLFEKGVYALMNDNKLLLREDGGSDHKPLSKDSDLVKNLLGEGTPVEINVFARDLVLFRSPEGRLVSNRLPYTHADAGITGLDFYGGPFLIGPRKVLAWGPQAIGILDFRRLPADKEIFEKGVRLAWVYRQGSDIRQAFWVYDATHVLFLDGDEVFLLEMEGFGSALISPVTRVKKGSSLYYSEDTGRVYFLDSKEASLASIEILPKRKMQFPFPDFKEERKESGLREV